MEGSSSSSAENKPVFRPDGSVAVPAFSLPVSGLVSQEEAAAPRMRASCLPATRREITISPFLKAAVSVKT
jgi:hypothetical protein